MRPVTVKKNDYLIFRYSINVTLKPIKFIPCVFLIADLEESEAVVELAQSGPEVEVFADLIHDVQALEDIDHFIDPAPLDTCSRQQNHINYNRTDV